MQKTVYLDQKDWIQLSRAYYGKDKDPKLNEALQKVIEASNKGIIFPVSAAHQIEAQRRMNIPQKERLGEFIIKICKGYTILPYYTIINKEIKEAFFKHINYPYLNRNILKRHVIGKGISTMLGAVPTFSYKDDSQKMIEKEVNQKLINELEKPYLMKWGFTNTNSNYDSDYELAESLEELEKIRWELKTKIPDNDLRNRYNFFNHMKVFLLPTLIRMAGEWNTQNTLLKVFNSKEKCLELMQDVPTSYCTFVLTDRRDRLYDRTIKRTDLYDIATLSIAIPYCDIVVADKMFHSIAKSEKLDELYQTDICYRVEELIDKL